MISAGVPPDSGTCRALCECFGETNVELAADLVEAAEAERVEASSLSSSLSPPSSPPSSSPSSPPPSSSWFSSLFSASENSSSDGSSNSSSSSLSSRPREALSYPPARLEAPKHLKQRDWSLFPVEEADADAVRACQGGDRGAAANPPSLPPPLVLDFHGLSRPAARVVFLVNLRRIVAAAAEPGK